jgi:predicted N-acetyltransferase YhbS
LDRAKELGHSSVIVLGHAAYYPKFGFQPASRWGIRSTYDVPDEVFMALELQPGALEDKSGLMAYPKEFQGV